MHAHLGGLVGVERAEHVGGAVVAKYRSSVIATATPEASSERRIFSIPSRIRPLIVPIGASSSSAISLWV